MYNSLNGAARDGYLDLLERLGDDAPAEVFSQEPAATLASISDIYQTYLTEEEVAALNYPPLVYFDLADQMRRLLELSNVILEKYITTAEALTEAEATIAASSGKTG